MEGSPISPEPKAPQGKLEKLKQAIKEPWLENQFDEPRRSEVREHVAELKRLATAPRHDETLGAPLHEKAKEKIKEIGQQLIVEPWLEKQFNSPETLLINGEEVQVLDIRPHRAKTKIPVVFAPGYATSSPAENKVNILEMVRQKRRTLYVDKPRGINYEGIIDKEDAKKFEDFLLSQVAALIGVLEKKGIEKVDVMAHSEGSMYTIVAASLYPEKFRDLVLFNPAGMVGPGDTRAGLIERFLADMFSRKYEMMNRGGSMTKENETQAAKIYRVLIETISWVLGKLKRTKGPVPDVMSEGAKQQVRVAEEGVVNYFMSQKDKSLNEIRAIARTQIHDLLKIVHEQGIGITIVHGVDDTIFSMEKVQAQMAKRNLDEDLPIDGFLSVRGGHGEMTMSPEKETRAADAALTALEKKRKKKEMVEVDEA